jgi:hypothetical protein
MIVKVTSSSTTNAAPIALRCPSCRQLGTFEHVMKNTQDLNVGTEVIGERKCPNPKCSALIFFVWKNGQVLVTYPPERIDFDATSIPANIVSALEEAISCHSSDCFVAAAIMVRKTLEELCRDRGAKGANLKDRIRDLGSKVLMPQELFNGLDDLRLLGNDAAHIESQEYDKVGKEEVEVGIEFAKEVLKAVFQYSTLLARLRALKKTS